MSDDNIRTWRTPDGWRAARGCGNGSSRVTGYYATRQAAIEALICAPPAEKSDWLQGYEAGLKDALHKRLEY